MSTQPSTATDELNDKAAEILTVISKFGGEAHTRRLTQATDYSNSKIWNHIQTLKRNGYVEKIGTVEVKAPRPANNYRITEEGQRVADELDSVATDEDEDEDGGVDEERIEEIEQALARHEREKDRLQDRVGELEATLEKRTKALRQLSEKVERLE